MVFHMIFRHIFSLFNHYQCNVLRYLCLCSPCINVMFYDLLFDYLHKTPQCCIIYFGLSQILPMKFFGMYFLIFHIVHTNVLCIFLGYRGIYDMFHGLFHIFLHIPWHLFFYSNEYYNIIHMNLEIYYLKSLILFFWT